jgi:hypothetical protein
MTIRRAARAIWLSRANAMSKVDARILARAALGAIEEPTPKMIEAVQSRYSSDKLQEDFIAEIWRVAHLAMMKEKPQT